MTVVAHVPAQHPVELMEGSGLDQFEEDTYILVNSWRDDTNQVSAR